MDEELVNNSKWLQTGPQFVVQNGAGREGIFPDFSKNFGDLIEIIEITKYFMNY